MTGRIQGTVKDAQGGVVPGVGIEVVNKQTGQRFQATTDELGFWALPSMPTATYTITVSLPGFKSVSVENVKVDAGVPATVNATLEVGAISDVVEVTSGAEVLFSRRRRQPLHRRWSESNSTNYHSPAAI
jgi:hypothetical protein